MILNRLVVARCLVLFVVMCVGCIAVYAYDEFNTYTQYEFSGVVKKGNGLDANDMVVPFYYLQMNEAIIVGADDIGSKAEGIDKLQLVFMSDVDIQYKELLNKFVVIRGTLFHSHTAHHHTKVLLEVNSNSDVRIR